MEDFAGPQRPLYEVKANLFKGLAHPVRIRVLELLAASPEVPVSDLLEDIGLEAPHLSQHLSVLRQHHLVLASRRGSQVFYRLAYPQVADLLVTARILLDQVLRTAQHRFDSSAALPGIDVMPADPGTGR